MGTPISNCDSPYTESRLSAVAHPRDDSRKEQLGEIRRDSRLERRGQMRLTARQKYDYRDLDRGEAQLIRVGHALWRDRLKLGDTVAEREGINAALESVWNAKREYRTELVKKRALRLSKYRDAHKQISNVSEAALLA